jgi:septum formation protein
MKIILATSSPYRIEAMKFTGIPFEAIGSNINEYFEGRPNKPRLLVKHLSKLKAEAVAKDCIDSLVIGMDSVGYFEGDILEKPKSYEEVFERLKGFSGRRHQFYTGVTMINTETKRLLQDMALTTVKFRYITEQEIETYLKSNSQYNTYALGYDPLSHLSSTFIYSIEGDPHNLLRGIPLARVTEMIREAEK